MPVDAVDECVELSENQNNEPDLGKRAQAAMKLNVIVERMINQRMNEPPRGDVVDMLLTGEVDGEPLVFKEVLANAHLLILAGLETTSNALSVAYHFLGTHVSE